MNTYEEWLEERFNDPKYLGQDLSRMAWDYRQRKIDELKEQNKKMREALEFYADVESYNLTHVNQNKGHATNLIGKDHYYNEKAGRFFGGKRARQCLEEIGD